MTPLPSLRAPPSEATKCVQPLEDVQAVDDQDEIRPAAVPAATCLPANFRQEWTADEESLVPKESQVTHKVAYQEYIQTCRKRKLPVRTFDAFKRKRQRLMT